MSVRWAVFYTMAALGIGSAPGAAQDSFVPFDEVPGWTQTPVTNEILDGRIAAAAHKYRGYAIPRAAFYDIALPQDSSEFEAMSGFGLIVLTVIVQDSLDVKPQQVYLLDGERRYELALLAAVGSPTSDSASLDTFGPWRSDAVYLVPVAQLPAHLVVDFAGRTGFFVTSLENEYPSATVGMPPDPTLEQRPGQAAVGTFMHRQYPGLLWPWSDR